MIVGRGQDGKGGECIILGLSRANIGGLVANLPIGRDISEEMKRPCHLLIVYGETEDSLMAELKQKWGQDVSVTDCRSAEEAGDHLAPPPRVTEVEHYDPDNKADQLRANVAIEGMPPAETLAAKLTPDGKGLILYWGGGGLIPLPTTEIMRIVAKTITDTADKIDAGAFA